MASGSGGANGGEDEDGSRDRERKKVRGSMEVREESLVFSQEGKKALSYKDTLVDAVPKSVSLDARGSGVFEEAWKDHIEGLKGFFGDGSGLEGGSTSENQSKVDDENDIPTLVVTKEEYERWCAPWRKSLIIHLLGKKMSFWGLQAKLQRLWKTKESFSVRDIDNGYFVVSFNNEEDMNSIYFEGPWLVADHYLLVQRWRPNFNPWNPACHQKIAAWIRIPMLPLEFFNAESLSKIGSLVGKTLKVDSITYLTERGRYARLCVELDLSNRLKPAIKIFGKERYIEYEGLHLICFQCGKYGHHRDNCTDFVKPVSGNVKDQPSSKMGHAVENIVGNATKEASSFELRSKRVRETAPQNKPVDDAPPRKEILGAWNLVKRPIRKKSEIPFPAHPKEHQSSKSLQSSQQGKVKRDIRVACFEDINSEGSKARFSHGTNSNNSQFGKDITKKKKWVPVDPPRRKDNIKMGIGKENTWGQRQIDLGHDGPHGKDDRRSTFLNSSNPFNALMGLEEEREDHMETIEVATQAMTNIEENNSIITSKETRVVIDESILKENDMHSPQSHIPTLSVSS